MPAGRGVRKVNENVLTNGRGIIITEQDKNQYKWSDIPVGSKLINTQNGLEYVKIEGESDWVPSKIKNDGTLCIAKDSIIITEIFTIVNPNEGNGKFSYTNSEGKTRHMPFTKDGYTFELEKGTYQKYRNHLDVIIDDCLFRNTISGGVTEVTTNRFMLTGETLIKGQEITVRYIDVFRIGNPYPRFFMETEEPSVAEIGDLWINPNEPNDFVEEGDLSPEYAEPNGYVPWSKIRGTPTSVKGYGIKDNLSYVGHQHKKADISDFPTSFRASGGNADTVANRSVGLGAGQVPYINSNGKLDASLIPTSNSLKTLTLKLPDGSTKEYNGSANVNITLNSSAFGIFDSQGRLVFPNGNKFWIK